MKKFETPVIVKMDDLVMEPVYFASGNPYVPAGGDWNISTSYANHNSGSHSEIKVEATYSGSTAGDNLSMTFKTNSFKIDTVTPGDSCLVVTNQTADGFTLTRTGRHFNPNENVGFVFQLTAAKEDGNVGAVGTTGEYMPCDLICTSYEAY